jgi:AraC-like DNA-binding protein
MIANSFFTLIKDRLRSILAGRHQEGGSLILPFGGLITCRKKQLIRSVSFHKPGLILVINGTKSVYFQERRIACRAGEMLAVPALSRFDMTNQPQGAEDLYLALFLEFNRRLIERLRLNYGAITARDRSAKQHKLHFKGNEMLYEAVFHYLQIVDLPGMDTEVLEHRLLGVLLCLVTQKPSLHMLLSLSDHWQERVYSILLAEPGRRWKVADICAKLAVSESTLRRRLKEEGTDYHTILADLRLNLALTQVQMTYLPIYEVALNCGYQSASQFTRRFRERFGVTPTALRESRSFYPMTI